MVEGVSSAKLFLASLRDGRRSLREATSNRIDRFDSTTTESIRASCCAGYIDVRRDSDHGDLIDVKAAHPTEIQAKNGWTITTEARVHQASFKALSTSTRLSPQ